MEFTHLNCIYVTFVRHKICMRSSETNTIWMGRREIHTIRIRMDGLRYANLNSNGRMDKKNLISVLNNH